MITVTKLGCDSPHVGGVGCRCERQSMATHSFGPGSPAPSKSYSGSHAWNHHNYASAALRAGLIAMALLAILAIIVLA